MPRDGLSLVGFMQQPFAMNYLKSNCILSDDSDVSLRQHWDQARTRLGPPSANPGQPEIHDIPSQHAAHLQPIAAHPRFSENPSITWEFKFVEIEPLVVFQFHVVTERAADLCRGITGVPQLANMLPICLPHDFEPVQIEMSQATQSVIIRSRSTNFKNG